MTKGTNLFPHHDASPQPPHQQTPNYSPLPPRIWPMKSQKFCFEIRASVHLNLLFEENNNCNQIFHKCGRSPPCRKSEMHQCKIFPRMRKRCVCYDVSTGISRSVQRLGGLLSSEHEEQRVRKIGILSDVKDSLPHEVFCKS